MEALERATVTAWPGLLACEVAAITVTAPLAAQQEKRKDGEGDGKSFLVIVIEERALGEQQVCCYRSIKHFSFSIHCLF